MNSWPCAKKLFSSFFSSAKSFQRLKIFACNDRNFPRWILETTAINRKWYILVVHCLIDAINEDCGNLVPRVFRLPTRESGRPLPLVGSRKTLGTRLRLWLLPLNIARPETNFLGGHSGKYHNTLCLSPEILHKHCFCFLLGPLEVPRETGNNAYAKFWGTNKEYYKRGSEFSGGLRSEFFRKLKSRYWSERNWHQKNKMAASWHERKAWNTWFGLFWQVFQSLNSFKFKLIGTFSPTHSCSSTFPRFSYMPTLPDTERISRSPARVTKSPG